MLTVRLAANAARAATLALPVNGEALLAPGALPEATATECAAAREQARHSGQAGEVRALPRPLRRPQLVLLAGVGAGDPGGWRTAGAEIARAAVRERTVTVATPPGLAPESTGALVEGLLLGSYRFRLGREDPATTPRLARVTVAVDDPERHTAAVAAARSVAGATRLARDLTNLPSSHKSPGRFVRRVQDAAARRTGVRTQARQVAGLREGGFGGILAVGAGSASPPRLLELTWDPPGAQAHVVLVGKGITFDTGGLSIKPSGPMTLMRKDMGGAAAVVGATLGAADLDLPVRVTALAPLAENMPSGSAMRPGDVVRHWNGRTTEIRSTDAEGRLVLADALAYASDQLQPDALVDLATLTGANAVALGTRTGALYSDDDALAAGLEWSAAQAGERVWRMPLPEDYLDSLRGECGDLLNGVDGGPGSVLAALYLREFAGAARAHWAHIDMSAPSWVDRDDGELSHGATGWGVRTLLRWLASHQW